MIHEWCCSKGGKEDHDHAALFFEDPKGEEECKGAVGSADEKDCEGVAFCAERVGKGFKDHLFSLSCSFSRVYGGELIYIALGAKIYI